MIHLNSKIKISKDNKVQWHTILKKILTGIPWVHSSFIHLYIININDTKIINSIWDKVCIWDYLEKTSWFYKRIQKDIGFSEFQNYTFLFFIHHSYKRKSLRELIWTYDNAACSTVLFWFCLILLTMQFKLYPTNL